ncbi:hypothetical protein [Bacillus cereus group sp. RP43]|uniref:hypothetical protein n=1 Tax=Bacillus cereus group sp. RP43 TaxID=3040260 RepID=UPI00339980A2
MSAAVCHVKFKDNTVLYALYSGNSDIVRPQLHQGRNDVSYDSAWIKCECGNDESVRLYTEYGSGFSWDGRACKKCMTISDGVDPYGQDDDFKSASERINRNIRYGEW